MSPVSENNLMFESYVKHLREHHDDPEMTSFLQDKSALDLLDMIKDCCPETYAKVEEFIGRYMEDASQDDSLVGDESKFADTSSPDMRDVDQNDADAMASTTV